jgi:RNA recognition motif-containing protein
MPFFIDPTRSHQDDELCHKGNLVGKTLYVGNLTDSLSSMDLQEWFTPFGTVQSAHLITDRDTGRSRGFGFVEMDTDAQAQAAIRGLHDLDHEGRWLIVCEAKPGDERSGGGRSDGIGQPYGFDRKPLSYRP